MMKISKLKTVARLFLICFLLSGCMPFSRPSRENSPVELGRGINIGNALESPKGWFWGVEIKKEHFDAIKDAGFDTVRLPVRFSDYLSGPDNRIDEDFLERVDRYVDHGLSLGLNVVLDLHHFTEIMTDPENEYPKLPDMWRQLSERYRDYPPELLFEILNEPQGNLGGEMWNKYLNEVIGVIRETNPDRLIIVGGEKYNSVEGLEVLSLPKDDNIIVTFHYYVPAEFTFQGNPYHEGYEYLRDVEWKATDAEVALMRSDFEKARDWAVRNNVEVFLGEFGAVKTIPFEYRAKWTMSVIKTAEEMGFSWCYWELGSWFGIFDDETMSWDNDMLQILMQE